MEGSGVVGIRPRGIRRTADSPPMDFTYVHINHLTQMKMASDPNVIIRKIVESRPDIYRAMHVGLYLKRPTTHHMPQVSDSERHRLM